MVNVNSRIMVGKEVTIDGSELDEVAVLKLNPKKIHSKDISIS
jgi:hypothetical protein